jgi:hypothetical protein
LIKVAVNTVAVQSMHFLLDGRALSPLSMFCWWSSIPRQNTQSNNNSKIYYVMLNKNNVLNWFGLDRYVILKATAMNYAGSRPQPFISWEKKYFRTSSLICKTRIHFNNKNFSMNMETADEETIKNAKRQKRLHEDGNSFFEIITIIEST